MIVITFEGRASKIIVLSFGDGLLILSVINKKDDVSLFDFVRFYL